MRTVAEDGLEVDISDLATDLLGFFKQRHRPVQISAHYEDQCPVVERRLHAVQKARLSVELLRFRVQCQRSIQISSCRQDYCLVVEARCQAIQVTFAPEETNHCIDQAECLLWMSSAGHQTAQ